MQSDKSTVERALELARSGSCRTIEDLRRQLTAEQYHSVSQHLAGTSFNRQLRKIMAEQATAL